MSKDEVSTLSRILLERIAIDYGLSNHQPVFPYLEIEDSPYDDADDVDLIAEYKNWENSLVVYWKNIASKEMLIKTLLHEYQHYLQSPSWFTRYYSMGHGYNTHPYEIAATEEESKWEKYKL